MSIALENANKDGLSRASNSFKLQGFIERAHFEWDGGSFYAWQYRSSSDGEYGFIHEADTCAACVGPLWYKKRFGVKALPFILRDWPSPQDIQASMLHGNYSLFVYNHGRVWLMNDVLGFVRIFCSDDGCYYSTSWLATCAYAGTVTLNEAAALEYILLGAVHSCETVAKEVTVLPLGQFIDLNMRRICQLPQQILPINEIRFNSMEEAAESLCVHLKSLFAEMAETFPGRIKTALSGGFDSRLILAGLMQAGVRPHVFVYGSPESADVKAAKAVAETEGIELDVIDKSVLNRRHKLPDIDELVRSAVFFDGLPIDGIYDPGADRYTRLLQTADRALAINGGGGEIFRNFFHLCDHQFRLLDIVRAFYRGFSPRVFRQHGQLAAYEYRLVMSMAASIGLKNAGPNTRLTRRLVELIYPLFRCHHWMAVNNSVAIRHGAYITPLVSAKTIAISHQSPMKWKNAGRLESQMISYLHREIAAYPSSYGFAFDRGPSWRAKLAERSTSLRPIIIRPWINALRRYINAVRPEASLVNRLRMLLPGEWELEPWLDLKYLPDSKAYERVFTIELLFRHLL